jgi:poly-gamma-glutamate synthesis protein (capsule biosynthesis protein)
MVSLIEPGKMAAEINALRPLCDYLMVSMHWGEEYRMEYNESQMRLAALLAEHQVDLVIGHHPHVLEPFVIISRPDGGSMPVFYSLGNFLSAHARPFKEVLLGGVAYVKLKKSGEETSVDEIGLLPIITHYEADLTGFSVFPLIEYTEELAEKHWRRINDRETTLNFFNEKAQEIFGPLLILENPFTF